MKKLTASIAIAGLLLAACGNSEAGDTGTNAGPAPAATGAADTVAIEGFAFATSTLTVAKGTTVTFDNKDSAAHTVTADDGSFASPVGGGAAAQITFDTEGTFTYFCEIHPSMTATVIVQG